MKSREEILQGLPHMSEYPSYIHENDVEQAMTEYADQFAVEFAEWVRKFNQLGDRMTYNSRAFPFFAAVAGSGKFVKTVKLYSNGKKENSRRNTN